MEWTERETKLLALALNVSASKGEIDNAAVMIVRSLRERKITFETIIGKNNFSGGRDHYDSGPKYKQQSKPDWGSTKINFGKYKGKAIKDVPPDYLVWLRNWINESLEKRVNFKYLTTAINQYLGDA